MEKKSVTNSTKVLLTMWNIGLFALIWFLYYGEYAFDTYASLGGFITVILYFIVYSALCNLYKAFRIASSSIGETVFSQFIAFGIADLLLYVKCCLIFNQYVNIWPGAGTVVVQLAGTSLIVMWTKRYFMKHVPPKKTILVYGNKISIEDAEAFQERILRKYSHLFRIEYTESEDTDWNRLQNEIIECETILLYELSYKKRALISDLCIEQLKNLYFTPRVNDIILQGCTPKHLLDTPLMKYDYVYQNGSKYWMKRAFDLIFSLIVLLLASPIMLLTAIAIKIEDHGPVFFKQKRCTKDAKVFEIVKFRSMIVDAEKNGATPCAAHDSRITKVGKVIRATRIDELPQLLNILKGDMSFVGPRPERIEHVEEYIKEIPEFVNRMKVKGGLTGYAQIYGKYNTSAYDKLRLDMMYIENQSMILDLKIIMLTIRTMFTLEATEGFSEEKSREMNKKTSQVIPMEATVEEYTEIRQMVK